MRTAAEIAREVRAGRLRAVDVLAESLAAIDARNPAINAFTARLDDTARRDAAAVDAAVASGRDPGVLAGVPFAVKNLYDIAGLTTIAGARIHADRPPATQDSTLVQRLKANGAVLVGALNMDAYAYGFTTENSHYGATHNPHDLSCIAGGSSGGSAAALAAGMVPLTLASDTNGSIRVPASLCGIFGMKPTFGRLSRAGSMPFVHDIDVLGFFASTTADVALAYDAMRGPDPRDFACANIDAPALTPTLVAGQGDLRVAVADGFFAKPLAAEVRAALSSAARALGTDRRVTLPEAERARAGAFVLTGSTAGSLYLEDLRTRPQDFEPLSRDRLIAGALTPGPWIHAIQRFRRWYHDRVMEIFETVDAILAPATPCSAFPIGTETIEIDGVSLLARPNLGMFTQPISFIGLPVLAVPIEVGSRLPIGLQVIAAPWREDVCVRIGAALEAQGVAKARITGTLDRPEDGLLAPAGKAHGAKGAPSLPPDRSQEGTLPLGGKARSAKGAP